MIHRFLAITVTAACLALALSCGTEEPPAPGSDDYFPLAVGNYWVYKETGYDNLHPELTRQFRHEVMDTADMDFEHDSEGALPVFIVEDTFPPPSEVGADDPRKEYFYDDGTVVVRKRQETYDRNTDALMKTRDYEPGLPKFDRSRTAIDDNWDVHFTSYTVSIPAEPDDSPPFSTTYMFRILDPETTTVPAGTFECMKLSRFCTQGPCEGEEKIFYFAPGVGKVKEVTDELKTEELTEYQVESSGGGV